MKTSKTDFIFNSVNYSIMLLFCVSSIYPFLYLLSLSFSPSDMSFAEIHIVPPRIDLASYRKVFASAFIASGYKMTIARTVLGTFLTLFACTFTAYPLSKKYFPHRTFWTMVIVFTMFFGGGLIPTYLLVRNLGILNTIWALVLPQLVATFSMIIMRNFFMALPQSLEESARIDGANDLTILLRIIMPVSKAVVATVILWTAVWHWNAWFDSLIYMSDAKKHVVQIVLRRVVLEGSEEMMDITTQYEDMETVRPETVKAATVMVVALPIIALYPFIQRYFVKGIMIGSLKG